MTGYFKGPSLTAHAMALGIIEGTLLPFLRDNLKFIEAISIAVLVGFVYATAALLIAIRGK